MLRNAARTTTVLLAIGFLATACAGPGPTVAEASRTNRGGPRADANRAAQGVPSGKGEAVVEAAESMLGVPYRYGGTTRNGVDCSGLVVYSFGKAGIRNLPRTASGLEERSRPVSVRNLEPGDLLFFTLSGRKTSHVGIYVGNRAFVHAPSRGKRVERVRFDHVYWGPKIRRAGRLL